MCNKMSDVRLSNASPTLERVDARQPDNLRPPVNRNLFGRPDPEEIRRNVEAVVQEGVQTLRERYNYDPVEDRPLSPRNFEWQEESDPPDFYRGPPHGIQRPRGGEDLSGENNRQDAEGRSSLRSDRDQSKKRRRDNLGPCSSECPNKRKHTHDDDDDDDERTKGAGSQAVKAADERPRSPKSSTEVH